MTAAGVWPAVASRGIVRTTRDEAIVANTQAGWYDDGAGNQRWWDGEKWTDNVQPPQGTRAVV